MTSLRIGPYPLASRFALSPMAAFTSWPLRLICQEFGAAFACTEMVKARFVVERHAETMNILTRDPRERLCGGQICGSDPAELRAAAQIVIHELGFHFLDFNIACPIRRIIADGAGSGLLSDPAKVKMLVQQLVEAADPKPVTVKMRLGLTDRTITAVEVAMAAEAGGASLIALHPRTASQGYGGKADHRWVARVKESVAIPVVGGGDMQQASDAVRLLLDSGCDAVYFGRWATGDPWLFYRAQQLLQHGEEPPGPKPLEVFDLFERHVRWLVEHLGEYEACLHARKLAREYARHLEPRFDFYEKLKCISKSAELQDGLQGLKRLCVAEA